jgi:predicted kinase
MVAACEALKPADDEFRDHNAYDVVEALLGKSVADQLRSHPVRPQDVRSVLFHRGEFRGDEFVPRYFLTSFDDPTFDEGLRHLARIASNATIEWLKSGGTVVLQPARRRPSIRRRLREYALVLAVLAFVIGWLIGWLTAR